MGFFEYLDKTYNETVSFWTKDGALADAADAVSWSVSTDGRAVLAKKADQNITDAAEAVGDAAKSVATGAAKGLVVLVIAAAGIWYGWNYLEKKAKNG